MSIPATLLTDIDTAFTTAFSAVSVDFYAYESASLNKVPCATLVPRELSEIELIDTAARIGRVEYTLRYYERIDNNARHAWSDMKAGVTKCVDAVSRVNETDQVRAAWIENAQISAIVTQQNKPELVCEFRVVVVPAPNAGA